MRPVASLRKRMLTFLAVTVVSASCPSILAAEDTPGYYTDPATGIVYRQVVRTIERPVVETKMMSRQETVYKPKTITETRPTTVRSYTPVTEFRWVPKVEGRWNPFRQPTVAYQHVPATHWQATDQVIAETRTHVQWEPETQTVEVPQRLTRMAREQRVDFEPVGRVAPPPTSVASSVSPEIASRLRPLSSNTSVQIGGPTTSEMAGRSMIAARENPRSTLQTGLRATELSPGYSSGYVQPLGASSMSGVAGLAPPRLWR